MRLGGGVAGQRSAGRGRDRAVVGQGGAGAAPVALTPQRMPERARAAPASERGAPGAGKAPAAAAIPSGPPVAAPAGAASGAAAGSRPTTS